MAETWANEVRGGEVSVRARQHYGFRVAGNRRCKRVVSVDEHGLESDAKERTKTPERGRQAQI